MKKLTRDLALFFLKHGLIDTDKAILVCQGFATDDEDFVEVLPEDYESLKEDKDYQAFEIWLK